MKTKPTNTLTAFKAIISNLLFLLISCTSEQKTDYTDYIDIKRAPVIEAKPFLSISPSDNIFFGNIADITFISDGRVVVLDDELLALHLISRNGELVKTFQFEGRGPGEVKNLSNRLRTTEDNIIAIDDYLQYKIALFQLNDEDLEHITDVAFESSISDFYLINKNQLVLWKSTTNSVQKLVDSIQIVDLNNSDEIQTIREFPAQEVITLSGGFGGLNFTINTTTQFHTRNEFCSNGDRLYHIRTDSLGFRAYNLDDRQEVLSAIYNQPSERITNEEKEREVDRILESGSDFWGNDEKARLISEMPDYKPQVKRVKCDLPNGIWLELLNDEEKKWMFISDEGKIEGVFQKTMEGQIISFHQGYVFASETDDIGDITLNIYKHSGN